MKMIKRQIYIYRLDIIGLALMVAGIHYIMAFIHGSGMIVFSDIDFPFYAKDYLNQIIGVWNHRFNTTAMLNTPRLLSILPSYLISAVFGFKGEIFFKVFLFQNLYLSCFTFYVFIKRLLRIYYNPVFNLHRILLIVLGSLYYGMNPWVMFRIQHIYLLVGYSLFPLVLLQFFKIFDHKFQLVTIKNYQPGKKIYRQNVLDSMLLGLIISVSAGAIHYFFYTILLFLALVFLLLFKYSIQYRTRGIRFISGIYRSFILKGSLIGGFTLGFAGFWLFVYVGSIVTGVAASQNNVNVLDTYTAFSQHSDIVSVLFLISYWWPMVPLDFLNAAFYLGGAMILLIGLGGIAASFRSNHVVLFLGLLGSIMAILATGVYYLPVAKIFLMFVDLPVIGSLFRDPNKLVGIFAICSATVFVFGCNILLSQMEKIKYAQLVQLFYLVTVSIGTIAFLLGMQDGYSDYFYEPVEVPEAYEGLKDYYEDQKDRYSIYMPLAEEMLQQSRVATPYWNTGKEPVPGALTKSTGDIHIYNAPVNTLFHHEGNDLGVGYYLRFMQFLMDEGRSPYLDRYVLALGSDQLIYHKEYMEQEERQEENLQVLSQTEGLSRLYENEIFTVYEASEILRNLPNQLIYTSNGLEATSIYNHMDGFHPLDTPVIYAYQDISSEESLNSSLIKTLDFSERNELVMQMIDQDAYVFPFDWIEEGNPFLKWSKTYVTSTDWAWYMSSQDIYNRAYNFDYNGGLAVTYGASQLDVLPYEKKYIQGIKVMDFDGMLAEEIFFEPDNKELFEVQANPYYSNSEVQSIHGELIKGDPKDIWQVAKSGYIPVLDRTPYQYELVLSGRYIEGMHFKVRFFDQDMEELGIAYVVASEEAVHFDTVDFVGEVISPKDAQWMRIDLLTYQRPEVKSYWWIHDVAVYELSAYSSPNSISGVYSVPEKQVGTPCHLYVRAFQSPGGGACNLVIQDKSYRISTIGDNPGFKWFDLGITVPESQELMMTLTADDGFNAVNCIVVTAEEQLTEAVNAAEALIEDNQVMVTREMSMDMQGIEQIQSRRTDEALSFGKGVDLAKSSGYVTFDILKEGVYTLDSGIVFPTDGGRVEIEIVYDDQVQGTYVLTGSSDNDFDLYLEEGSYQLVYDVDSEVVNYAPVQAMAPFDPGEIFLDFFTEDLFMVNCSECEHITPYMMEDTKTEESIDIYYDPTCSCDWYIYSSDYTEVMPGEEWYVRYLAQSENLIRRHGKIIYVDRERQPVGYTFISEVEEKDKSIRTVYEQIFEVPEGASGMYLQFWARGDKKVQGHLSISDLQLNRYTDFITLDHLIVREEGSSFSHKEALLKRVYTREGEIAYEGYQGAPAVLNTYMSPNQYFTSNTGSEMIKLNGVTAGYLIQDGETIKLGASLYKVYIGGLILFFVTGISSGAYLIYDRRAVNEKDIGH